MNIEIGNKKIDFVYQGDNLLYPNYAAKENLVLHYDFSGMKNTDVTKAVARDLSSNRKNGSLNNFGYVIGSGYNSDSISGDGVDDYITMPSEFKYDSTPFTFEFTVKLDDVSPAWNKYNNIARFGHGNWWIAYRGTDYIGLYSGVNNILYPYVKNNRYEKIKLSLVYLNDELMVYEDGIYVISYPIGPIVDIVGESDKFLFRGVGSPYGKVAIYNFLKYNKALTPSEIAQNYAIDKKRFNITD